MKDIIDTRRALSKKLILKNHVSEIKTRKLFPLVNNFRLNFTKKKTILKLTFTTEFDRISNLAVSIRCSLVSVSIYETHETTRFRANWVKIILWFFSKFSPAIWKYWKIQHFRCILIFLFPYAPKKWRIAIQPRSCCRLRTLSSCPCKIDWNTFALRYGFHGEEIIWEIITSFSWKTEIFIWKKKWRKFSFLSNFECRKNHWMKMRSNEKKKKFIFFVISNVK